MPRLWQHYPIYGPGGDLLMNPVMYIFLNKGAGMSTGKAAAQAAHAAVEALGETRRPPRRGRGDYEEAWRRGGHYTKLVMEANDDLHLYTIKAYLNARGFRTALIIDEGRTEVEPHTITALGVEIVDKDDEHTAATFSTFTLYKDGPCDKCTRQELEEMQSKVRQEFEKAHNSGKRWWQL